MKRTDYLIVALAPLPVMLIPLIGNIVSPSDWRWTAFDFVVAWVVLAGATFVYRAVATSRSSNLPYRLATGLAVAAGLVLTWINLAVQVIGDDNPGNLLYFLAILGGLVGVGVSRFNAANLAKVAFGLAAAVLLVPAVAVFAWPVDFNPGPAKVFIFSGGFAAMFAVSGLLYRRAAGRAVAPA
jgi:hypothetical protein